MIGIDIVSIQRIEKFHQRFKDKGLRRFLSKKEIKLANNKPQTLAGFWASKEAISKALGVGIGKELGFLDIKIRKTPQGAPYFRLTKKKHKQFNIKESSISISHDGGFAIAVVDIQIKSRYLD